MRTRHTQRSAYRYLVEEIIPEELGHRELLHTQWVQHFSTWKGVPSALRNSKRSGSKRYPDESESAGNGEGLAAG